jgi:hypothetical protein
MRRPLFRFTFRGIMGRIAVIALGLAYLAHAARPAKNEALRQHHISEAADILLFVAALWFVGEICEAFTRAYQNDS